jgi:catechol 2,3-dioxygenase-like lactoylglutathione lyase family enzyme
MNLGTCSTALFVKDIERSKEFYVNLLGFAVEYDFGTNIILKGGFALWQVKEDHLIPQTLGVANTLNQATNRFELYCETENLQETYQTLKDAGVAFLHEVHEEEWGQHTIRFFDPDRHLIEVGESLKQLVKRLHGSGLTAEEVSAKTYIALDDIVKMIAD